MSWCQSSKYPSNPPTVARRTFQHLILCSGWRFRLWSQLFPTWTLKAHQPFRQQLQGSDWRCCPWFLVPEGRSGPGRRLFRLLTDATGAESWIQTLKFHESMKTLHIPPGCLNHFISLLTLRLWPTYSLIPSIVYIWIIRLHIHFMHSFIL